MKGFGDLNHEFWLGNDKLFYLTNDVNCTLRIDLVNRDGVLFHAEYEWFLIKDEEDNYRMFKLGAFRGNTG